MSQDGRNNRSKDLTNIAVEQVQSIILVIRDERVILDSELAKLYGVTTARLNQQVRRNAERFPADFVFNLTKEENESLMLQFATSKRGRGGSRKLPLVFTEHGAIMAANVLNSQRAVRASVEVVRAFIYLRRIVSVQCKTGSEAERIGEEIRSSVSGGLRCDSAVDDTIATKEATDWLHS